MLSAGRHINEVTKEATNAIKFWWIFLGRLNIYNLSERISLLASCPKLMSPTRMIVMFNPDHKERRPSSLIILLKA